VTRGVLVVLLLLEGFEEKRMVEKCVAVEEIV